MRGQISLEYLIVAMISISLVSISFVALNRISADADKAYNIIKFKSAAYDIFIVSDELCALGNGNSRTLALPFPLSISSNSKDGFFFITALYGNSSVSSKTKCKVSINEDLVDSIKIVNRNGEIINEK